MLFESVKVFPAGEAGSISCLVGRVKELLPQVDAALRSDSGALYDLIRALKESLDGLESLRADARDAEALGEFLAGAWERFRDQEYWSHVPVRF